MANKSDDDYWFTSDTKAFSFEDDTLLQWNSKSQPFNYQGNTSCTEVNDLTDIFYRSDIPIRSVLSQHCIEKLLNNDFPQKASVQSEKLAIQTVENIILSMPYSLGYFKSLQSKTLLLDTAINYADGNAILSVILFLENTLKKDIFYNLLSTRRIAILHYINYLSIQLNIKELTNLLILTEYSAIIVMKLFKMTIYSTISNTVDDNLKKKLEAFRSHLKKNSNDKDNIILKNYIDLLDWQLSAQKFKNMDKVFGQSTNKSLAICCQYSNDKTTDYVCSMEYLSKSQNIGERQVHWIYLDVKSSNHCWEEIIKMFIKNNWFGTRKVMTSSLCVENVVAFLSDNEAPGPILSQFLVLMEDSEQALSLALRYHIHHYVINHYLTVKDRTALLKYRNSISPQTEEYFLIENAITFLVNK